MVEKTAKEKKAGTEKKEGKDKVKPEKTGKAEKQPAKEKKEEKTEPSKTYVIPLDKAFWACRTRRAKSASKVVRAFLQRHIAEEVKIDSSVNEFIHSRGKCHIPRKVKVAVSKQADKTVVSLAK